MKLIKAILAIAAIIWIVSLVAINVGGAMLTDQTEVAAEAIVEKSGIKEQVDMVKDERCRVAKANLDNLWERSIEKGSPDNMEAALDRAEASVAAYCPAR